MTLEIWFECDGTQDFHDYLDDLKKCGAKIIDQYFNYAEGDSGFAQVSFDNQNDFMTKFRKTEAYSASNIF